MADAGRALLVVVALVSLLAGCGSGVPEYLTEASPGAEGRAGDVVVTDVGFAYDGPIEGDTVYPAGEAAVVQATIVNQGSAPDRLVSVDSPVAGGSEITGERAIPGGSSLAAGYTDPIASVTLPRTEPIEIRLTDLARPIRAGLTYPVKFRFARAGEIRLAVPVATPDEPRPDCPLPVDGKVPRILTAPPGAAPPPTNAPPACTSIPASVPEVQLVALEAPLLRPTWSPALGQLLGLVAGSRLVRVDAETGETLRSRELSPDVGENVALVPRPTERLAIPVTGADRVALFDTESLAEVGSLDAGPAPSWVSVEATASALFALAEDGSTVTGVDPASGEELFQLDVGAGPEAVVAAGDDVDPSFWLVTPTEVTYFTEAAPAGSRSLAVSERTFSSEDAATKSAYLAEEGTARVALLEGDSRGGLEIATSRELAGPVEHVEATTTDEYRVYAVTSDALVSLKYDTLEMIRRTDFRTSLEQVGLPDARISGITVGADYVYLAVADEPLVLKIRKEESLTE